VEHHAIVIARSRSVGPNEQSDHPEFWLAPSDHDSTSKVHREKSAKRALGDFDGAAEDCWAAAVFSLKTQQNVMNKPIRITRRIRAKSEFFWKRQVIEDRASRGRILHREWQV
jgi:hypothetical protein